MGWLNFVTNRSSGKSQQYRRDERHVVDSIRCELGTLLDLSVSGMRLLCTDAPPVAPGQVLTLRLGARGGSIEVVAMIRWKKRLGLRKYQVGLQFAAMPKARRAKLEQLARFGFVSAHMSDDSSSETTDSKQPNHSRPHRERPAKPALASVKLPDYYSVLGVQPGCDLSDIRKAFHLNVKRCHPDLHDGDDARTRFIEVHRAWEILGDPSSRKTYDRSRRRSMAS